jgi:site-specific DNA-methyltransferase (adenine-specific)
MQDKINKIIQADCLDYLKELPDECVDLVLIDPPYKIIAGGVRVEYSDKDCGGVLNKRDYSKTDPSGVLNRGKIVYDNNPIGKKWQKMDGSVPSCVKSGKMFEHNDIKFAEWLPDIFRVLKMGTHAYIMVNARNLCNLQIEAEKVGFAFQNLLVWDKGNATPNKYYMQCAEFILMLSKRPARNINDMGSKTIITVPNIIGNKTHPTEKPIDLLKQLICNSAKENDIVLDCFAGSGSLAHACIETNRNFLCCEKDEKYVEVANKRIANITKSSANFGVKHTAELIENQLNLI